MSQTETAEWIGGPTSFSFFERSESLQPLHIYILGDQHTVRAPNSASECEYESVQSESSQALRSGLLGIEEWIGSLIQETCLGGGGLDVLLEMDPVLLSGNFELQDTYISVVEKKVQQMKSKLIKKRVPTCQLHLVDNRGQLALDFFNRAAVVRDTKSLLYAATILKVNRFFLHLYDADDEISARTWQCSKTSQNMHVCRRFGATHHEFMFWKFIRDHQAEDLLSLGDELLRNEATLQPESASDNNSSKEEKRAKATREGKEIRAHQFRKKHVNAKHVSKLSEHDKSELIQATARAYNQNMDEYVCTLLQNLIDSRASDPSPCPHLSAGQKRVIVVFVGERHAIEYRHWMETKQKDFRLRKVGQPTTQRGTSLSTSKCMALVQT